MAGPTHIVVPHQPSAEHVKAIVEAVGAPNRRGHVKDVVVVCSLARTPTGRATMRQRLCHAGLPGKIAGLLGWSTVAPEPAPTPRLTPKPRPEPKPQPAPEPEPEPEPDFTMAPTKPSRRRRK